NDSPGEDSFLKTMFPVQLKCCFNEKIRRCSNTKSYVIDLAIAGLNPAAGADIECHYKQDFSLILYFRIRNKDTYNSLAKPGGVLQTSG
ncbi:hypothetical protein, partial [Bacillus pumilus]